VRSEGTWTPCRKQPAASEHVRAQSDTTPEEAQARRTRRFRFHEHAELSTGPTRAKQASVSGIEQRDTAHEFRLVTSIYVGSETGPSLAGTSFARQRSHSDVRKPFSGRAPRRRRTTRVDEARRMLCHELERPRRRAWTHASASKDALAPRRWCRRARGNASGRLLSQNAGVPKLSGRTGCSLALPPRCARPWALESSSREAPAFTKPHNGRVAGTVRSDAHFRLGGSSSRDPSGRLCGSLRGRSRAGCGRRSARLSGRRVTFALGDLGVTSYTITFLTQNVTGGAFRACSPESYRSCVLPCTSGPVST
jgi:hypothetical protein